MSDALANRTPPAQTVAAPSTKVSKAEATLRSSWFWAGLCVAAVWGLLVYSTAGEWQINPQYNYGYVVPVLGLTLFWRRWPGRPVPGTISSKLVCGAFAVLLLPTLPLRLVLEANPEWRLLYWLNGLQAAALTFVALYAAGGWSWVRFFAGPVLFVLIAIPWPMEWEQFVVQGLMRTVAGATVEVAGWFNIAAVQQGNLIEIGGGIVGIDEACSGVRSLQSALMLCLFLGEVHRFSPARRIGLLGASILFVLLANLCRTSFLVWTAAYRGLHRMEQLHDTAGLIVMCVVLPSLVLLAHLLKPHEGSVPVPGARAEPVARVGSVPMWLPIVGCIWLLFSVALSESWYRLHERNLISNAQWSVAWPVQSPAFRKSTIPEKSLEILRCSQSQAASWQDETGNLWSAFLLKWAPGKNSAQLAKGHRPDICFTAAGASKLEDFGFLSVNCAGMDLTFRHQVYESRGELLHVFYCLWSDRRSPHETLVNEDGSRSSRIDAVLAGKRHLGQQVLEIVIAGPDKRDRAAAALCENLPKLIRRL